MISERNHLRNAGRVPQETLDYLAAKDKDDRRGSRVLEIPILVIAVAFVAFDIVMLVQSKAPFFSGRTLGIATPGFLMAIMLIRLIRRLLA